MCLLSYHVLHPECRLQHASQDQCTVCPNCGCLRRLAQRIAQCSLRLALDFYTMSLGPWRMLQLL